MTLSGSIAANRTLFRDTLYKISGVVKVNGGATLTIQPGTRIEGIYLGSAPANVTADLRGVAATNSSEAAAVGEVVRALLNDFGDVAVAEFIKELDGISPDTLTRLAKLADDIEENNDEKA